MCHNEKISVIIPAYNAEKMIDRCVKSILQQSYSNLEVIVIDDGSIDRTKSIINEISLKDKRLIYKFQSNAGVSAARNAGIKCANGDMIAFVDADDWLEQDALEKMYLAMDDKTGFVCCGTIIHNKDVINNYSVSEDCVLTRDETLFSLYSDSFVRPVVWGKLYRSNIIKDTLEFNTEIAHAEDIKFVSDFTLQTKKNSLLHYCGYHYFSDNMNSAMHQLSIKKASVFNEKWISSWQAYEEMERSLMTSDVPNYVYKRFVESRVECGKSCLKILYNNYQDNHALKKIIKKYIFENYFLYLSGDREKIKTKISTLTYIIFSPDVNRFIRRKSKNAVDRDFK